MTPRPNWDSPTPPRKHVNVPPPGTKGWDTMSCIWGWVVGPQLGRLEKKPLDEWLPWSTSSRKHMRTRLYRLQLKPWKKSIWLTVLHRCTGMSFIFCYQSSNFSKFIFNIVAKVQILMTIKHLTKFFSLSQQSAYYVPKNSYKISTFSKLYLPKAIN